MSHRSAFDLFLRVVLARVAAERAGVVVDASPADRASAALLHRTLPAGRFPHPMALLYSSVTSFARWHDDRFDCFTDEDSELRAHLDAFVYGHPAARAPQGRTWEEHGLRVLFDAADDDLAAARGAGHADVVERCVDLVFASRHHRRDAVLGAVAHFARALEAAPGPAAVEVEASLRALGRGGRLSSVLVAVAVDAADADDVRASTALILADAARWRGGVLLHATAADVAFVVGKLRVLLHLAAREVIFGQRLLRDVTSLEERRRQTRAALWRHFFPRRA